MIYLFKATKKNLYKIGEVLNDPARRLSDVQTSSPYDLELIVLADGDKEHEKKMHKLFEEYRVQRAGTEWFEFTVAELYKIILKLMFGDTWPIKNVFWPSDRLKKRMKQTFNLDEFLMENYQFSVENQFSTDEGLERSQIHDDILIYMKKAEFDDNEIVNMTRKKVIEALKRHPCGKKELGGKHYYNMQRDSMMINSREL
jgi:hypothetical protein